MLKSTVLQLLSQTLHTPALCQHKQHKILQEDFNLNAAQPKIIFVSSMINYLTNMQTTRKKFSIPYFLRRESFQPQTHFSIANFFVKNKTR